MYRREIPARVRRAQELRSSGVTEPQPLPKHKGSRKTRNAMAIREQVA